MRFPTMLALAAAMLLVAPPALVAQSSATDSVAVREAVQQFHSALARGDSVGALQLLAGDAVILEAGGVETRAEYAAHHLAADIAYAAAVPGKAGPFRVVVAGDAAWATSTSEAVGSYDGRAVNSVTAELVVLTRTPAGWRIRAISWSSRRRATS